MGDFVGLYFAVVIVLMFLFAPKYLARHLVGSFWPFSLSLGGFALGTSTMGVMEALGIGGHIVIGCCIILFALSPFPLFWFLVKRLLDVNTATTTAKAATIIMLWSAFFIYAVTDAGRVFRN